MPACRDRPTRSGQAGTPGRLTTGGAAAGRPHQAARNLEQQDAVSLSRTVDGARSTDPQTGRRYPCGRDGFATAPVTRRPSPLQQHHPVTIVVGVTVTDDGDALIRRPRGHGVWCTWGVRTVVPSARPPSRCQPEHPQGGLDPGTGPPLPPGQPPSLPRYQGPAGWYRSSQHAAPEGRHPPDPPSSRPSPGWPPTGGHHHRRGARLNAALALPVNAGQRVGQLHPAIALDSCPPSGGAGG